MTIIEVNQLSFRYPQVDSDAIHDLNFKVEEGEFFCIVGSSGSGKSTLCHALVGLIPHYFLGRTTGNVKILNQNLSHLSLAEISQQVGLVFQDPYNQLSYTTETVEEEIAYGLESRGVPRLEMKRRILDVAVKMGLESNLKSSPLSLSGGQLQRVAFGCAVVLGPKILVLDECTSQLDPEGAIAIFKIIKQLNDEGITVIMADNSMERVAEYADRILLMKDGKKIALGTVREVCSQLNIADYGVEPPEYLTLTQNMVSKKLISSVQVKLSETLAEIQRYF